MDQKANLVSTTLIIFTKPSGLILVNTTNHIKTKGKNKKKTKEELQQTNITEKNNKIQKTKMCHPKNMKFPTKGRQILPVNIGQMSAYSCTQQICSEIVINPFPLPSLKIDDIKHLPKNKQRHLTKFLKEAKIFLNKF